MIKIVVPTLNAAAQWPRFSHALLECVAPEQVLIVDSESTDGTPELARQAGFQVHTSPRAEFNHGTTRREAANMLPDAEVLVYMTQDAILCGPDSITQLIAPLQNPEIGMVFGRQLGRTEAGAIEAHARLFNYPAVSSVKSIEDRYRYGFKTVFVSNSFAAYRRSALMQVGNFPRNVILSEDTVTAGRLLLHGYKVAYAAEATVYHSHPHNWRQEFRRYFDIGVLHGRESWLLENFGSCSGEGKKFVLSELRFLLRKDPLKIPSAIIRTGLKFLGYKLGRMEHRISPAVKCYLSMSASYWTDAANLKSAQRSSLAAGMKGHTQYR